MGGCHRTDPAFIGKPVDRLLLSYHWPFQVEWSYWGRVVRGGLLYLLGSAVACFVLVPFHCSDLYRWSESASCFFCLAGLRFSFAGGLSHFFGFTGLWWFSFLLSSRFVFVVDLLPDLLLLLFCVSKLCTFPLYCCSPFEYSKSTKKKKKKIEQGNKKSDLLGLTSILGNEDF